MSSEERILGVAAAWETAARPRRARRVEGIMVTDANDNN